MSGMKSDCHKFFPNVFNKTKCQNCFRAKDSHSAEALESNRASRNVSKCGYLFVAPDWDFNVSVNRTKRWQRRWFVLYDDGELTYSLDEFPDTIPQGVIDMNKVLDVSDAEGITGNDFAVSITTPDKVHFIKGTSKEESKWWFDVLCCVAPRYLSRVKHKRNATFPCGKATIPTPAVINQEYSSKDDMRLNKFSRPKFLSTSEVDWLSATAEDEDVFSDVHNAFNKLISDETETQLNQENPKEKSPKNYLSELEESENRRRNRRYLKRENRIQRNQRSRNDGVSKMITPKNPGKSTIPDSQNSNATAIAAAEKLEYLEAIHRNDEKLVSNQNIENKESPKNDENLKTNLRKSESLKNIPAESENHPGGLRRYHSFKGSHRKLKASNASSLKRSNVPASPKNAITSQPPVLSNTSANPVTPVCQPLDDSQESATEGAFTRTGWLLRETHNKDWSRHWFVLKDSSLTYYRDPSAEHCGIMDGILDLNQVSSIKEQESDKYYAISLKMWDGRKHVLAAETEEFRNIWIQTLQYASNLWSSASKEDFICSEIVLPDHTFHQNDRLERLSPPSSLLSYVDANNHDSSPYTSDDQSEYFSLVDEDEASDLSSSPRTLPPSPPINRNVISLVKEKSRSRCSHGSKTNSPSSDSDMTSCAIESNRQSKTNHDYKNNQCDILREEESFETESLMNGDDRPISPITPPIEFMNEPRDILKPIELDSDVKVVKYTENKTAFCSRLQLNSPDSKFETNEGCTLCVNMKNKLVSAQEEIKKLEKELKEAHASFDTLEMFSYKLTQDMKLKEENYKSQIALMSAKIDDLTSKFTLAEKSYRQLKQKASKNETKERRRSSLKNKEGLSITKEYETKLCKLEKKIGSIESSIQLDHFEIDELEKSQSDTSSKLNESFNTTSESSETSTPMESNTAENKGLFSRLQSLMSRVDNVSNLFSKKENIENAFENPKILLQIRDSEELSSLQEHDEWQPSTSSDTLQNSQDSDSPSHPKTLTECQSMLSQKLNEHFLWLKNSLETISEQATNDYESNGVQLNIMRNITLELNELCQDIDSEQNNFSLTFLLLYELERILEKLSNVDNINTLLKSNATRCAFKTILQTLCIAFVEYENYDFSGILNLVSSIPQINFFCPLAKILFSGNDESTSQSINLSELLQSIEYQMENVLTTLSQAKLTRYDGLWNILAEVPVQDEAASKPAVTNSILDCTTSIATDIHRIAELQLRNVPTGTLYLLKIENESIQRWGENSTKCLKKGLTNFLDELKTKCPMLHESAVSLHRLSESMRNNITHLIVELSFLNVCQSLLKSMDTELIQMDEDQSNFSLHKEWLSRIKNSNSCVTSCVFDDTFQCPQCSVLRSLTFESAGKIQWDEYVKKYNYYNVRKANFIPDLSQDSSNTLERSTVDQKDVCNNVTCPQCDIWIQKYCAAEMQHEVEQRNVELKHNTELKQLEECIIKTSEIHDQEMLQKENELSAVTAQLQRLKIEYEDQKQMLRDLYEKKLNFDCEITNQDNIREMYRLEIEDLKDMFKEGLSAIENSHNRITAEMEKRHAEEIALLEAEKQRALEIEAQATLTALEAMKKYHTQELVETTASIKKDMKKIQNEVEKETLCSKYRSELDKLKEEILRITEMYSSKCLENVVLEDKVNSLQQQLKEAQNELCSLLTRNKDMSLYKASRHF